LKCLVGNCCLPTYEAIHAQHLLHSFSNFIPGLAQYGDTPDVAALIAPRPLHLNFGAGDASNPFILVLPGLERIKMTYEAVAASSNFSYFIDQESGHTLSPAMWEHAIGKFRKHL
jgi:hypothetical protein